MISQSHTPTFHTAFYSTTFTLQTRQKLQPHHFLAAQQTPWAPEGTQIKSIHSLLDTDVIETWNQKGMEQWIGEEGRMFPVRREKNATECFEWAWGHKFFLVIRAIRNYAQHLWNRFPFAPPRRQLSDLWIALSSFRYDGADLPGFTTPLLLLFAPKLLILVHWRKWAAEKHCVCPTLQEGHVSSTLDTLLLFFCPCFFLRHIIQQQNYTRYLQNYNIPHCSFQGLWAVQSTSDFCTKQQLT